MEFGTDLKRDVVALPHDGALVMQKYGRNIPVESQLCYNHAKPTPCGYRSFFYKRQQSNDEVDSDENDVENSDADM